MQRRRPTTHRRQQFRCTLTCICAIVLAASSGAQARDYFVNPNGADGAFPTVQSAVDAVIGQTETNRANIFVAPARYVERVTVDKPFVTFIGQGALSGDVNISFDSTPVYNSLGETVSIRSSATAFMARNLTFENSTADHNVTPGLAVGSYADRAIFDDVRFLGYQDTLLVYGRALAIQKDQPVRGYSRRVSGRNPAKVGALDCAPVEYRRRIPPNKVRVAGACSCRRSLHRALNGR